MCGVQVGSQAHKAVINSQSHIVDRNQLIKKVALKIIKGNVVLAAAAAGVVMSFFPPGIVFALITVGVMTVLELGYAYHKHLKSANKF